MAKTGRVVSLKIVADRLMQNPVMKDVSWEFMVDKAVEIMSLLDAPAIYVSKQEDISVVNYKAKLPTDVMSITQVLRVSSVSSTVTSEGLSINYSTSANTSTSSVTSTPGYTLIPMREGTDSLHDHYADFNSASAGTNGGETYSVNKNNIFTNFETGTLVVVYKTIATDEECYPLVTNNPSLIRCIESYIKYRWFDILNDMDQISDRKFNKAEVDYLANVAQADANLKLPSDDEMETLVNQITQLIPSRTQHADRFTFLGAQEYLRIH